MFIERGFELVAPKGFSAMVTMQSWMFLSSYEKLRCKLMDEKTICCMVHMANMVMGIAFGTAATVWQNYNKPDYKGSFSYVNYEELNENGIPFEFPVRNERLANASAADFKKIPGAPIIYWFSEKILALFTGNLFGKIPIYTGMATSDNNRFLRYWHEVTASTINFSATSIEDTIHSGAKWYPYNKGGGARRWYGNLDYIVNFSNNGEEIKIEVNKKYPYLNGNVGFYIRYQENYFKEGLTWSAVTSGTFTVRKHLKSAIFSNAGFVAIPNCDLEYYIALLNSIVALKIVRSLAPTLNFNASDIAKLPIIGIR